MPSASRTINFIAFQARLRSALNDVARYESMTRHAHDYNEERLGQFVSEHLRNAAAELNEAADFWEARFDNEDDDEAANEENSAFTPMGDGGTG